MRCTSIVTTRRDLKDIPLGAGQDAELPLNWGAEGQEGPVLATGDIFSLLTRTCSIVTLGSH